MLLTTNGMAEILPLSVELLNKTNLLYITLENSNKQVCKTLAELAFTTDVPILTYKPT